MKRIEKLALLSAIVLSAAACQREPATPETLTTNETKEVTTQFVLNVASAPTTKQSADVVQLNGNFRGIQDGLLFTYKTGMSGTPYVLDTANPGECKVFELGSLMSASSLSNGDENGAVFARFPP